MSSSPNISLFMVACVISGVLVGVQGAPRKTPNNGRHKDHEDQEPLSYRLILGSQLKDPNGSIRPIHNDSISPWVYIYSHDVNRIPSHIGEAKCLLSGCLNVSGEESRDMESRPIYRQIVVLRRVPGDQNNYQFQLEHKTVSVGCTCVRPYVEHV